MMTHDSRIMSPYTQHGLCYLLSEERQNKQASMKRLRGYVFAIFVVTACYALVNLQALSLRLGCPGPVIALERKPPLHPMDRIVDDPLTLRFGDLPGYTGWARPVVTTAAWYEVKAEADVATAGVPFVYHLHCRHEECRNLEALFDTRAYGPAIITGTVHGHHNGSYTLSMVFHDRGEYVVEIVLAFSHVAPLATFPSKNEPMYEGYLLPGLPTTVQVIDGVESPAKVTSHRPTCRPQDVYEANHTSVLHRARWKVTQRNRGTGGGVPDPKRNATFEEYKFGAGSIGFAAGFVYRDCHLPKLKTLVNDTLSTLDPSEHVVVFIGDSHMRKQYKLFLEHFGDRLTSLYLKTNDGLLTRFPDIRRALKQLKDQQQVKRRKIYILFNAGLHEIDILCSQKRVRSRGRVISIPDEKLSCTEQYRSNLIELTELVLDVPDALRVFQSTSAGWIKWGN